MRTITAILCLGLSGCFWFTTKDEGKQLDKKIGDLDTRLVKQEQSLDERVKKLDDSIEKASKLLTTTGANLGADVEKLEADQTKLLGQIGDLERQITALKAENEALKAENARLQAEYEKKLAEYDQRIEALESKAGLKPGGGGTGMSELDRDALLKRADSSFAGGQWADARRDYREFVRRFPNDVKADDAQFALGEIYFNEKVYDKAMGEYQKVIDGWPSGDMIDSALFRAGEAAEELKWCLDARAYFGLLTQKYPKSKHLKAAKKKLDYLKKNAKNKKICTT